MCKLSENGQKLTWGWILRKSAVINAGRNDTFTLFSKIPSTCLTYTPFHTDSRFVCPTVRLWITFLRLIFRCPFDVRPFLMRSNSAFQYSLFARGRHSWRPEIPHPSHRLPFAGNMLDRVRVWGNRCVGGPVDALGSCGIGRMRQCVMYGHVGLLHAKTCRVDWLSASVLVCAFRWVLRVRRWGLYANWCLHRCSARGCAYGFVMEWMVSGVEDVYCGLQSRILPDLLLVSYLSVLLNGMSEWHLAGLDYGETTTPHACFNIAYQCSLCCITLHF